MRRGIRRDSGHAAVPLGSAYRRTCSANAKPENQGSKNRGVSYWAASNPVAGQPLSNGEYQRQRVCKDSSLVMMIPGRPGDGITQSPLNCSDDIARTGFFKAPQLRNVALTAPYFHNGSQLTLEQVVEYYNRGGDFNSGDELKIMDPDIDIIGFTLVLAGVFVASRKSSMEA